MTLTDLLAGRGLQAELSRLGRRRALPRPQRMSGPPAPITYNENDVCTDAFLETIPRLRRR